MKKLYYPFLYSLLLALAAVTLLSGCTEDDDYWPYSPPPGWGNYFYDDDLYGTWELFQVNSQSVSEYETNYMEFYGGGRGRYYYYDYGRLYGERMAYFCQMSGNTTTSYQINVQYENGEQSTMAYWFTDGYNTLWLQWQVGGRTQTYMYQRVNGIP